MKLPVFLPARLETDMNATRHQLSRPQDLYLSTTQVAELEELLLARAEAVIAPELAVQPEDNCDEVDFAVANSTRDFNLRLADRERKMLGKVRVALERIRDGEYGTCVSCGEEIGFRRLQARPFADKCIDCKTTDEMIRR